MNKIKLSPKTVTVNFFSTNNEGNWCNSDNTIEILFTRFYSPQDGPHLDLGRKSTVPNRVPHEGTS